MSEKFVHSEERLAYLASLQDGLGRTFELAQFLIDDPTVGNEARCLLSRLVAIQAEIEIIANYEPRPRPAVNDSDWPLAAPLWNS